MDKYNDERRPTSGKVESGASDMSMLGGADGSEDSKSPLRSQSPNLDFPVRYRANATGETSRDAAAMATKTAKTQRERVLAIMNECGLAISAEGVTLIMVSKGFIPASEYQAAVPSVRPRLSELARHGLVRDSGKRGDGLRGAKSIMWELTPADQIEAEAAKYKKPKPADEEGLWAAAFKEAGELLEQGKRPIEALAMAIFDRLVMEGRLNA